MPSSRAARISENTILHADCLEAMAALPEGSVDLVFADPPFNIGYEYDVYDDQQEEAAYLDWSRKWIAAVHRVLKPTGTFWLAIGDEYAAELKLIAQRFQCGRVAGSERSEAPAELPTDLPSTQTIDSATPRSSGNRQRVPASAGASLRSDPATHAEFAASPQPPAPNQAKRRRKTPNSEFRIPNSFFCRSWVVWYYTFGVNCKYKFSRSHAHLFHFVKDPKRFTFNSDDPAIRVASARQLVYADGRANPDGRLPDDTWILRPQDLPDGFTPNEDTWYFPRVAGTFKERAGFHGCQMPEQLLGRIIRACSNAGELVLDPFSGSATTLAVAKKLGRRWLGFDLSEEYVQRGQARLKTINEGDPLNGAAEPLASAPPTAEGKRLGDGTRRKRSLSRNRTAAPSLFSGSE